MVEDVNTTDRRGEFVAGLGLAVSLAGFFALVFLGRTNFSLATYAAAWQLLGSAGVWILILVRLHQGRLLQQERFELAELERDRRERLGGAGTIFKEEDVQQMEALSMGRRLRTIEKWFIPIFAMLTAAFLGYAGLRSLATIWPWEMTSEAIGSRVTQASMLAFVAGGLAFLTFALSRYALGMARVGRGEWTPLRAGGAFFFGNAVVCLLDAIVLVLAHNGYDWPERWLATGIGALLLFLAAEMVVNFVLDFYRPRVAGEPQRVFYESRLLGVFCEPEGIIHSVAQTIDYQFGFKVSETWFYQFLQSKIVPLILFQVVVLYLMTCFVVVPQGYQAVVEKTVPWLGTSRWAVRPGITFTWPWPMAQATLVPVERIRRIELGYDIKKEKEKRETGRPETQTILWTQKHRVKEYQLLVADRTASADTKVPVNLVSVAMPVQWRVKEDRVLDFYRQSDDVENLVEALAYGELTRYAAHADLMELIGTGGVQAAQDIRDSLQTACDHAGIDGGELGVEIVYVGLGGVHPPTEVAEAYEKVVNALEQKDTKIRLAQGAALKTQIAAGGEQYAKLDEVIVAEDRSRREGSTDLETQTAAIEKALRSLAGGEAGETAAVAEQYLYRRVTLEGAAAELFQTQCDAFNKSPRVYALRAYLRAMIDGLEKRRIYVIAITHPERVIYQLSLKPPPPLEVLQQEMQSFQEGGGK